MTTFRAVAIFPHIPAENFQQFCFVAEQLMAKINEQEFALRYDMFFNAERTQCTVLEEFIRPEGVFEHVKENAELLAQLSLLGGKIEGSVFPMSQDGEVIQEIKDNWDSKYHVHFLGKTQ